MSFPRSFLINAALAAALTSPVQAQGVRPDILSDPDFYPAFLPRAGSSSTPVNGGGPLRVSGSVLLDMGSGEAYNPVNLLTTENKFVHNLGKGFGIRSVIDPDGKRVTHSYTPTGDLAAVTDRQNLVVCMAEE